jgi:Tol biopolymer transport system component
MGRRSIVMCTVLVACFCAPAHAQLVYSGNGQLYEIDADGSDRGFFTAPTSPKASDSEPAWSPDGSQLAVVHERNAEDFFDRSRLDVLDADGSSRRSVTGLEGGTFVSSPEWAADGSRLAFSRFTQRSNRYRSAIVVRDLTTGSERTLVTERLGRRFTSVGQPEWSPDGESVVYSLFRLDRHADFQAFLYVVAADGGSPTLLAREAHSAAFSPDGSQIAFVSIADRNGTTCGSDECAYNGELYVMDAGGENARRLTQSEGDDMAPDWSADGSRIAFNSNRNFPDGYGHELYSIEPDGDCLTWLTNGTLNSVAPTWRPAPGPTDPGGCGATPRPPLVEVDLGPAHAFDLTGPLWLGLSHKGLLLSDVDHNRHEPLFFGYLDCGRYRPSDCPPGIQILVESVCSRDAAVPFLGDNNEPIDRRRGALVADYGRFGGVTVLTGGLEVHVVAEVDHVAPVRVAFRALRPFPRETGVPRLRPPAIPASLARQTRRVVRVYQRLGSVTATAEHLQLSRRTVRLRLGNAEALDDFGHRVRTTRC